MTDQILDQSSRIVSTEIRLHLIEKLFEPDSRRLEKTLTELVLQNKRLTGTLIDGFRCNGMWFIANNAEKLGKLPIVAEALEAEVEKHNQDRKLVKQDCDLIRQILHRLLSICISEEHCRNALPECLVILVPGLNKYPRNDSPGYTLMNEPRAYRQFLKALPKMEMYSALGLFY